MRGAWRSGRLPLTVPTGRAGGRRSPLPLLLAAACVGCGGDDGLDTGRPADMPGRHLVAASWDTLLRVGGAASDTLFLQATGIAADGRGVSLMDGFGGRVVRFDTAGRRAWTYGRRGAGPDEFRRPRDVAVDARGRTWVLDVLNQRLTVLRPDGTPAFRVPLDGLERMVDGVAPVAGDRAVLFALSGERPLVTVARTGEVVRRSSVPWAGFGRLNPLATQMVLAAGPEGERWSASFAFGDGFFVFGADGDPLARGWLAESVPFPGVTVTTSGSPFGRRNRVTKVERTRHGAVSATMSGERLYVLFGGSGDDANRWVDSYRLSDGLYAGSYRLPRPVMEIAYGGGRLYVVYDDPFPVLAALRPADGPMP